jgi:hypothetical protein
MSERLVVYKTPLYRILETALILFITVGLAALWHSFVPAFSASYVLVMALVFGFALVPRLGSRLAQRRGAPMMTREERTRRYLSELGPIGLTGTPRRSAGRNLRRG